MKFLTKKGKKGFTLIELLVVIAIIGVLASIVLASLNTARKKSRDTRRVADMNQAKLALELYFDSNRNYPVTPSTQGNAPAGLTPTYIATWPSDPVGGAGYHYDGLKSGQVGDSTANNTCDNGSGGTCAFFHTGATVEDDTITAMSSRAGACLATSATVPTGCNTSLDETTIYGYKAQGKDCAAATAAGQGCYDTTP